MNIRIASPDDAKALLEIYAPYVRETVITFEYDVPTLEDFQERISHSLEKYPYLCAEIDGEIVGYAYASAFKGRAAYDWSIETSIYTKMGLQHKGIGKALYAELERILSMQNVCNMCACIAYPNPESEAFHEYFGYKRVALFNKSGYKFDKWVDMIWMEKELNPHTIPPKPFIPFGKIRNNI